MDHPVGAISRACSQIRGEYQRAVGDGSNRIISRQWVLPQLHCQSYAYGVPVLPDPAQRKPRTRISRAFSGATIHSDSYGARPPWNSHMDRTDSGPRGSDLEGRALLAWKLRDLLDAKPFFFPIESGSKKLVYKNVAVPVEENRIRKLGEFFRAGAGAAPEGLFPRIVGAPISSSEGEEILLQTLRILSS